MPRLALTAPRRALTAAFLAVTTLVLIALLIGPNPARASHAGYVDVGSASNSATATTGVSTTTGNGLQGVSTDESASGLYGQNDNHGYGVAGRSTNCTDFAQICTGVYGQSSEIGVLGSGVVGVHGDTENYIGASIDIVGVLGTSEFAEGVRAEGGDTAVHGIKTTCGFACDAGGSGVWGETDVAGASGVRGTAPNGTGVLAESTSGTALAVDGRAGFSRSGRVLIPAGSKSIQIPVADLRQSSMVQATLQQVRTRLWLKAAVPDAAADTITIHLNRTAPADTKVAWFVTEVLP